jgi:hypothetical protein
MVFALVQARSLIRQFGSRSEACPEASQSFRAAPESSGV